MLCGTSRVPIIVPRHRLTRRQALKLGAATAALGALRPSFAAAAPPRAEAFTLDLADRGPRRRLRGRLAHDARARRAAPLRPDRPRLARGGGDVRAQVRARRRGGGWSRWTALHDAGDHGPDAGRGAAGTDPAWTGAADQFQLRLQGRARGLHARFVRSGPAARAAGRALARPHRRAPPGHAPADHPARGVGRRRRAAAQRPRLRPGAARVRPPHRQRERLRARGVRRDRARDREVPPRPQRLERPRLQLHRRPVRPDLRGPGGRDRPGDRRRAGAGLQQRLDRHRVPRHLHERRADRGRPGRGRAADRLEALAARRAHAGRWSP